MAKTCIGCGCTDDEPCVTAAGPCAWVSLPGLPGGSVIDGAPICSACVDTEGELGDGDPYDDEFDGDPGAYEEPLG